MGGTLEKDGGMRGRCCLPCHSWNKVRMRWNKYQVRRCVKEGTQEGILGAINVISKNKKHASTIAAWPKNQSVCYLLDSCSNGMWISSCLISGTEPGTFLHMKHSHYHWAKGLQSPINFKLGILVATRVCIIGIPWGQWSAVWQRLFLLLLLFSHSPIVSSSADIVTAFCTKPT